MILESEGQPTPSAGHAWPEGTPAPSAPAVELRCLDWDTAFFGARMGAIVLLGAAAAGTATERAAALERDLRAVLGRARAEHYAHVIFRVSAEDLSSVWAAEQASLRLVDVGIDSTFDFATTPLPDRSPTLTVRAAESSDVPSLRDLAASAFVLSRFGADPFFSPEQVAAFHREWVSNLCAGLAQVVLVGEVDGEPAGFVSCAISGDEGRIPLIATRAGDRRRGIGRGLVSAALHWFAGAGARVAHVKTQAHNYSALALYHHSGFVVSKSELTFSIVLGSRAAQ